MESHIMRGHVLQEDMSYSKTYHDIVNVLHDDMSCEVLVNCNHTFFLKILWVISNIWYLYRNYNQLCCCGLGNCCFFSPATFCLN